MTDHREDRLVPDEPAGGWQTGPELHDTELASVTLCRFTGLHPLTSTGLTMGGTQCPARKLGGHQDIDCLAVYIRQDMLDRDVLVPGVDVTVPRAGNEPNVIS